MLVAATGFTAGCVPQYQKPVDGPIAKLRFVSLTGDSVDVQSFADENCKATGEPGAGQIGCLGCWGGKKEDHIIGMPNDLTLSYNHILELVIPANKPFIYTMDYGVLGPRCAITLSFKPEPGKMYESVFKVDYKQKKCFVSLYNLTENPDHSLTRTPFKDVSKIKIPCKVF